MSSTPTTDRWFHDRDGRLVVAQFPNAPLIVWMVARLLGFVVTDGWLSRVLDGVGFAALFVWATLELVVGSAHIRRVFGAVVLVALVVGRLRG